MTTTPVPSVVANPLRTYQFRVGLLPVPPADPAEAAADRTTLAPAPAAPRSATQPVGEIGGDYVAGVRRVSGLTLTIAGNETWEGGNSLHRHANPNRATWEPITLEQGLALDDTLERWAAAAVRFLRTGTVDPTAPVKRNLVLDVWDPASAGPGGAFQRLARRYLVFNAWVSKFVAIPRLDAMADEVALLSVELTHHGWRADPLPTFDSPAVAAAGPPAAGPAAGPGGNQAPP